MIYHKVHFTKRTEGASPRTYCGRQETAISPEKTRVLDEITCPICVMKLSYAHQKMPTPEPAES